MVLRRIKLLAKWSEDGDFKQTENTSSWHWNERPGLVKTFWKHWKLYLYTCWCLYFICGGNSSSSGVNLCFFFFFFFTSDDVTLLGVFALFMLESGGISAAIMQPFRYLILWCKNLWFLVDSKGSLKKKKKTGLPFSYSLPQNEGLRIFSNHMFFGANFIFPK